MKSDRMQLLLNAMDEDGDGSIDIKEFTVGFQGKMSKLVCFLNQFSTPLLGETNAMKMLFTEEEVEYVAGQLCQISLQRVLH